MPRLSYWWSRLRTLAARVDALEHRVDFLNAENIRLNQVIRELVFANELKRVDTTRPSFDWQWGELPEGQAMPSNPAFLAEVAETTSRLCDRPADWFQGKSVLDAGCGSGRWSYGLSQLGAHVLSVDQSANALAATTALCAAFPHHRSQQADLLNLRLGETFDLVWCFGVCHHTEDMLRALTNVAACVTPGGRLFVMVYGYPLTPDECASHALYERWRQQLAPLPFSERVVRLQEAFPGTDTHGNFDAMSPAINELVSWEWLQTFLQDQGFTDVRRTIAHGNHHCVATRR